MSSETDEPDVPADRIEHVRIEDEMEQSYIDYAMSVIAGRALPDVRDGLKPVHRRILYAMDEMGVSSGSAHRKSSSIVGETMGDYHPHGDSAIYDTLVGMAQEFSMRYPLVDGQGNFGSMDGDPAAAMRYTEARMAPIAEELLADIDMDTVDFESNYDDRLQEPAVLPAAVPNLLVNGSTGIAVGMSTKIPPHNLGEVVDATVRLIDDPDCDVSDLVDTRRYRGDEVVDGSDGPIEGPDFPTGGNIVGKDGVIEAYATGRGRVRMRAEIELEEPEQGRDRIVVTELPYQENKARVVERIAEDVNEGVIEGIADLRDESDREGVRVVAELKRGANADVVRNQLLEHHLESTFGVINLALVDGKPRVLTLKETLEHYVDHRKEVVTRRSEHELEEAQDRAHILEGRLRAVENADAVVDAIQDSEDREAARAALRTEFGFSADQAAHVVRMQLGSLTSMEAAEIESEYTDVQARIERLKEILGSETELLEVIKGELREVKTQYDDERRTTYVEDKEVTDEDLIPEEEQVVVMSEDDYVKRMPLETFRVQNRGGKGVIGADLKDGDSVSSAFVANSHDYLLCFTTHGQVYQLKTYQVPEMGRTARGKSAVNVLDLADDEELTAIVNTDDMAEERYLTMVTRDGYVKRTGVEQFENILSTGIRAIRLEDGDELVDVEVTDGAHDLVVGTREGMGIRFDETEARAMGRSARGVRGIDLEGDDEVAALAAVADPDSWVVTVTAGGYGKRTDITDYRKQSRNGKGLIDIRTAERNGDVVSMHAVGPDDQLVCMTERGQIVRCAVEDVSIYNRNTRGVTLMTTEDGDCVATVDVVREGQIADDDAGDAGVDVDSESATAD